MKTLSGSTHFSVPADYAASHAYDDADLPSSSDLVCIIERDHGNKFNLLIEKKSIAWDKLNVEGRPFAHLAAEFGCSQVMQVLLKAAPENARIRDEQGCTPLHIAIKALNPQRERCSALTSYVHAAINIIKSLIDAGAGIDAQNTEGDTPLILAARYQSSDAVDLLLAHGANPDVHSAKDGWTPLMSAAFHRNEKMVVALLKAGADCDATTHSGMNVFGVLNLKKDERGHEFEKILHEGKLDQEMSSAYWSKRWDDREKSEQIHRLVPPPAWNDADGTDAYAPFSINRADLMTTKTISYGAKYLADLEAL